MEDLRRALKTEYTPSKASPELNMSFGGGVEPSIGAPFKRCAMNKFVTCHPEFISGSNQREANAPINRMLKLVQHDRVCWNKVGIGFSASKLIPGGCL